MKHPFWRAGGQAVAQAGEEEVLLWKMAAGNTKREWTDPEIAKKRLIRELRIERAAPRQLLTPPGAEKVLTKEAFERISKGNVTRKPGAPVLVPASSNKKAIDFKPTEGFKSQTDKSQIEEW